MTRPELCQAASGALVAAADQLRDYAGSRARDRLLLDVTSTELAALADWLDRRAWLLSVDPAALDVLTAGPAADELQDVDADDELLPLDPGPAVWAGKATAAGPARPGELP